MIKANVNVYALRLAGIPAMVEVYNVIDNFDDSVVPQLMFMQCLMFLHSLFTKNLKPLNFPKILIISSAKWEATS